MEYQIHVHNLTLTKPKKLTVNWPSSDGQLTFSQSAARAVTLAENEIDVGATQYALTSTLSNSSPLHHSWSVLTKKQQRPRSLFEFRYSNTRDSDGACADFEKLYITCISISHAVDRCTTVETATKQDVLPKHVCKGLLWRFLCGGLKMGVPRPTACQYLPLLGCEASVCLHAL